MHDQWTGPELDSLIGRTALTRREVIVTSLAVGFAAAASPVSADTVISTGTEGLTAGEVKVPVADGEIPAYRAMPAKDGKHSRSCSWCRKSSACTSTSRTSAAASPRQGYLAVAPELYARQGDPSKYTDWKQLYGEIVSKVPDAQVMRDLDATVAWAGKSGSGDMSRVGVTGFCWGGRIVWLYAAHSPTLKAGVAWYGRLVGEPNRAAAEISASTWWRISRPRCSVSTAARTRAFRSRTWRRCAPRSRPRRNPSEIVVYPDADHGFNADYRPSYKAEDAKDGWRRCLGWFREPRRRLGAEPAGEPCRPLRTSRARRRSE